MWANLAYNRLQHHFIDCKFRFGIIRNYKKMQLKVQKPILHMHSEKISFQFSCFKIWIKVHLKDINKLHFKLHPKLNRGRIFSHAEYELVPS
jgi:hypothetical protein